MGLFGPDGRRGGRDGTFAALIRPGHSFRPFVTRPRLDRRGLFVSRTPVPLHGTAQAGREGRSRNKFIGLQNRFEMAKLPPQSAGLVSMKTGHAHADRSLAVPTDAETRHVMGDGDRSDPVPEIPLQSR